MYEVIGNTQSRAFRVLWMLEELGQDYTHTAVKPHTDEARAANPSGKIPALRDGADIITDSTAIITYLADKHGALTHPAGTIARARQDALTHTILDEMDSVLWIATRHKFMLPEERRVPQIADSAKWEFDNHAKRFAGCIEGEFLMGDTMTVPDIIATHCLNWAFGAKFPIEDQRLLDYAKRMRAREAFKRASAA